MPRRKKQPIEKKRLTEQQIVAFGQIFPGFDVWYREAYDEEGKLRPEYRMPGLKPQQEEEATLDEADRLWDEAVNSAHGQRTLDVLLEEAHGEDEDEDV